MNRYECCYCYIVQRRSMMKAYLMELIGTFFLTVALIATGKPLAVGAVLMALVYIGGHISGAHYNPAVSLAMWLRGALPAEEVLWYMGSQLIGAFLAAAYFKQVFGSAFVPKLIPSINMWPGISEALLTFLFCLAFLTVVLSRKFKPTSVQGFVIGFTFMAILFGGSVYNPAIVAGTALHKLFVAGAGGVARDMLVYIVSPLIGGALAAWAFAYFNPTEA